MSSNSVEVALESVGPGGVLVVDAVVDEAAVKDADESVAESSQSRVVGVASGPMDVVEGAGTW
jgi:regulator of RNase E activity RraA